MNSTIMNRANEFSNYWSNCRWRSWSRRRISVRAEATYCKQISGKIWLQKEMPEWKECISRWRTNHFYNQKNKGRKFTRNHWNRGNRLTFCASVLIRFLETVAAWSWRSKELRTDECRKDMLGEWKGLYCKPFQNKIPIEIDNLWNQNQGSRPVFQDQTHHLLTSLQGWTNTTETRILVWTEKGSELHMHNLWTSSNIERPTLLDAHELVLQLLKMIFGWNWLGSTFSEANSRRKFFPEGHYLRLWWSSSENGKWRKKCTKVFEGQAKFWREKGVLKGQIAEAEELEYAYDIWWSYFWYHRVVLVSWENTKERGICR